MPANEYYSEFEAYAPKKMTSVSLPGQKLQTHVVYWSFLMKLGTWCEGSPCSVASFKIVPQRQRISSNHAYSQIIRSRGGNSVIYSMGYLCDVRPPCRQQCGA